MKNFNKDEAHKVFGEVWGLMNAVRKTYSDDAWEQFVKGANEIHETYDNRFYDALLINITEESEAEFKIQDKKQRRVRYEETWKAYMEAWTLLETLLDDFSNPKEIIEKYNEQHPCKFAANMGKAVYEVVSEYFNIPGSFMQVSYPFYQKYFSGINPDTEFEAYADAEKIIERHPEYMLQMMDMIASLKNRTTACAA